MLATTYPMNIWPPAKYLPGTHRINLAKDGKTELVGSGTINKKHFLLTVFDPCDVARLVTGRGKRNRFWEEDGIGRPVKGGDERVE